MQASNPIRASSGTSVDNIAFGLCLSTFAIALAVFSAYVFMDESTAVGLTADAQTEPPRAGTFTGMYLNGAWVYRLPAITVTASRKVEMARIEDARVQATAAAEKSTPRPTGTMLAVRGARD